MEGTKIKIGRTIKYLGLYIDENWDFESHFEIIGRKMEGATDGLCRLLPNMGGPGDVARKLYANTVHAIGLYGAPIWWRACKRSKKIKRIMHATQRRLAIRITRAYRTVGKKAVTLLAGVPPFEKIAEKHAKVYKGVEEMKKRGIGVKGKEAALLKKLLLLKERYNLMKEWEKEMMEKDVGNGRRVCEAIIPYMEEWLERKDKKLTFHMMQIFTGHGCFGTYLKRIGKEVTNICPYCHTEEDDVRHTVEECTHWLRERRELEEVLGKEDLSLGSIIKEIIEDKEKWIGFQRFCGKVMGKKEEDEKKRRGEVDTERESESESEGRNNDRENRKNKDKDEEEYETKKRIRNLKSKVRRIKKRKKRRWKTPAHLRDGK